MTNDQHWTHTRTESQQPHDQPTPQTDNCRTSEQWSKGKAAQSASTASDENGMRHHTRQLDGMRPERKETAGAEMAKEEGRKCEQLLGRERTM